MLRKLSIDEIQSVDAAHRQLITTYVGTNINLPEIEADFVILNVYLMSSHLEWYPFFGAVAVRGEHIVYCGPYSRSADELNPAVPFEFFFQNEVEEAAVCQKPPYVTLVAPIWLDGGGQILMPGLVNGHCHGDMGLLRGRGDGMTLAEQNEAFASHNWFQDFMSDEDRLLARRLTYVEALLSGTTFICENMYWSLGERAVEVMVETGIQGALVEDLRPDFRISDVYHSATWLNQFRELCHNHGLVAVAGCAAEEDFSPSIVQAEHELAAQAGLWETRHFSETTWRLSIVADHYGMTPTHFLSKYGVLHHRLIASHGVHLTTEDIQLLAEREVKVVNTPLCEMKIQDGAAPIVEMLAAGISVGLGTDGACWNNSNDIFREMKGVSLLNALRLGPAALTPEQVLDMATSMGAAVFGEEKSRVTIAPGMRADFILIDMNQPHFSPLITSGTEQNVASHLVYCATGQDVRDVFIGGKQIVEDRKVLTTDLSKLLNQVDAAANKITSLSSSSSAK